MKVCLFLFLFFYFMMFLYGQTPASEPDEILFYTACDPIRSSIPERRLIANADECASCFDVNGCDEIVYFDPKIPNECFVFGVCHTVKLIMAVDNSNVNPSVLEAPQLWITGENNPNLIRDDLPRNELPTPSPTNSVGIEVVVKLFSRDNDNAEIRWTDFGDKSPIWHLKDYTPTPLCSTSYVGPVADNFICGDFDDALDKIIDLDNIGSYSITPDNYIFTVMTELAGNTNCRILNTRNFNNNPVDFGGGVYCYNAGGNECNNFFVDESLTARFIIRRSGFARC